MKKKFTKPDWSYINKGPNFEDRTGHIYEDVKTGNKFGITHGTETRSSDNTWFHWGGCISHCQSKPNDNDISGPCEFISSYNKEWFVSDVNENNEIVAFISSPNAYAVQGWIGEYSLQIRLHNKEIRRIK